MSNNIHLLRCLLVISTSIVINVQSTTILHDAELTLSLLHTNFYDSVTTVTMYTCQTSISDIATITKLFSTNGISSLIMQHFDDFYIDFKLVEHTLVVLDISCNYSANLLDIANEYQMFSVPYKWLFISDDNITDIFKNIDILVDSDVTFAALDLEDKKYMLKKLFKRRSHTRIVHEDFGDFSNDTLHVNSNFPRNAARRRQNLQNITLNTRIVITHNESFAHLTDKRFKHIDTITKVNYIFMMYLGDMLNATMNISSVDTWGYLGNDSQWTGMIGELTRKHADIGGTPLFFTSDRVRIIDYIAMTTPTRSQFVFRQPKLSYVTNVYTLPFDSGVWMACLASVVITALGLYAGVRWEWHKRKKFEEYKNVSNTDELRNDPVDVAFVALAAVCQQGASAIPFGLTGRIITIVMYTSLMFLYTSYSANIVALLQSSSTSIQTLDDLLKSRLQVGVDDTVFNRFYFPNASEPIRRAIYLQKVIPAGQAPRYFPIDEGVRRIREGLFAFHMETGAGYKIVGETFLEHEKCGLQEIQFLQVPDPFLAVQKNTSFKEVIKISLRKLHESGVQNREVSLLYTKRPTCMSSGSTFMGVAIVDCYPAAMVFAIGMAMALAIFVLELLHAERKREFDRRRFVFPGFRKQTRGIQLVK